MASSKPPTSQVDPPFSPYQDSPTTPHHPFQDDLEHVAIEDDAHKPENHLLAKKEDVTPAPNETQPYDPHTASESPSTPGFDASHPYDPYIAKLSPSKSTFTSGSYDEEKLKTDEPVRTKLSPLKKKQRILDIGQRATTLALSVIILGIMSHAYITFLKNKDVTVDGQAIYPSFMTLWPTYLMITAGAVTVAFNACVLGFRIHGSVKDFNREELYNKGLDYVLHGINGLIWLGTSTSFGLSKNLGPASDPNVLWGYTCSSTASNLTETYPQIVKFYVQCELQSVSFYTAVSSVVVEAFATLAKFFVR